MDRSLGSIPSTSVGNSYRIARSVGLDDVATERLDDMRVSLETHRRDGLTEKNMTSCGR